MSAGRVVVVGSVNVDFVVVAPRLPVPGETVTGGDVARHQGGKGGNQAVAAARLGAPVAFVGAVGDDDLGASARVALQVEGIDVTYLATVERPTGVALIVVDERAENLIAVAPGANAAVTGAAVAAALDALSLRSGDVLLTCREVPPDAVRAALMAARKAGAATILDPAPAGGLDGETIGLADILTPNEVELEELRPPMAVSVEADCDTEAAARSLLAVGTATRAVVVTLGAAGALVVPRASSARRIQARSVEPLDTTGAGDAFNGALAAGLAAGLWLMDAAERAVAAAGLSTTRHGARAGMPSGLELDAMLASPQDRKPVQDG